VTGAYIVGTFLKCYASRMCSVVFLRRPDHDWPLIVGANRDEMLSRPWRPPARHWPDRPEVVAGLDELAGGSWLGINDTGVVAGALNRPGSLGPAPGLRSRGELVLEALDHADAADAAAALAELDGRAYRPFNLFVADNRDAFWLRNRGAERGGKVEAFPVPEGVSMLTARDLNDRNGPRVRLYLPRFEAAPAPDPAAGDWRAWEELLASREEFPGAGPDSALAIATEVGFGTSSSALIALPAIERAGTKPVWLFAAGMPEIGAYRAVDGLAGATAAQIVSARGA
jgi:uncharacterized protein with NRDE domain